LARTRKAGERPGQENIHGLRSLLAELHRLEDREAELAQGLADGTLSVQVSGQATKRITERRRELTEVLSRSLPVPASEPVVTSLVEVFSDDELYEAGLLTGRTPVNASRPFRARWEARNPEAAAQVRDLYSQVLGTVTVKRREVRGRGLAPERCVIAWRRSS
jgi:hypothetical protein